MANSIELLAQRLKAARTKKGFSQAKLAELSQVHVNTICRTEQGNGAPSFTTISLLANALGISVMELIEEPKPATKKKK